MEYLLFFVAVRLHQFGVINAECLRKLIECHDGGITPASLKSTEVLLAETGALFHPFLRQSFLLTKAGKIPANQFAHIHAQTDAILHTMSLSTIVCKYAGGGQTGIYYVLSRAEGSVVLSIMCQGRHKKEAH